MTEDEMHDKDMSLVQAARYGAIDTTGVKMFIILSRCAQHAH